MAQTSRASETRSATARPQIGGEARGRLDIDVSSLPSDEEATWIREECLGYYDGDNIAAAQERGYRPVLSKELPGYISPMLPGARNGSNIDTTLVRRGGQVLMARPKAEAEAERKAYSRQTEEALRSVARDTTAPKDGTNFKDLPDAKVTSSVERPRGKFSE